MATTTETTTTTSPPDDIAKLLESLRSPDDIVKLLDSQYAHVEEYCQVQTMLHNLLVNRGRDKKGKREDAVTRIMNGYSLYQKEEIQAIGLIKESILTVKNDLVKLHVLVDSLKENWLSLDKHTSNLLQQHLDLTYRVQKSVQDEYTTNGIPKPKGHNNNGTVVNSNETKMLALATLRASAARIKETLQ